MKEQTRTLRNKPKGEAEAESWDWVIWGLNGDVQRGDWGDATKRVSKLLLDMKELDTIREKLAAESATGDFELTGIYSWPFFSFKNDKLEKLNKQGRQLSTNVNKQLRFYKWSPGIS